MAAQRGFFVGNYREVDRPEQCLVCQPQLHLCNEEHQRIPKPAAPGIWIDPDTGDGVMCEPFSACIWHKSVGDVLRGGCADGYQVRVPPNWRPVWTQQGPSPMGIGNTHHQPRHAAVQQDAVRGDRGRGFTAVDPNLCTCRQSSALRTHFCLLLAARALQGYACRTCAASYYRDDDRMCRKCATYIWVLYVLAFLVSMCLAPLLLRIPRSAGFMSMNIFIGTMQVWWLSAAG